MNFGRQAVSLFEFEQGNASLCKFTEGNAFPFEFREALPLFEFRKGNAFSTDFWKLSRSSLEFLRSSLELPGFFAEIDVCHASNLALSLWY